MEQTRIEFLEQSLAADPNNTFVRYALAMELVNAGRGDDAWGHFERLLTCHPDYTAAYYQAGKLLVKLGRRQEAQQVLANGIAVTRRQGNLHAQNELEAALEELKSHESGVGGVGGQNGKTR
jgi:tetratricopeptide (TPR) repeat protein